VVCLMLQLGPQSRAVYGERFVFVQDRIGVEGPK